MNVRMSVPALTNAGPIAILVVGPEVIVQSKINK